MNKKDLQKLALLGIASGALLSSQHTLFAENNNNAASLDQILQERNGNNMNYKLMTEDELLLELNETGYQLYMNLSDEGKELAIRVASMYCNGTNLCAGLNACKTEKNECAGQGDCKGQGKCAFSDKNLAVKVVADKMKQKRESLLQ